MADTETPAYDPAQIDAITNGGYSNTQRVTDLMKNGYSWMPTQVLYAFASSGLSDDEIHATAANLTKAAVSSDRANAAKNQVKQQGGVDTQYVPGGDPQLMSPAQKLERKTALAANRQAQQKVKEATTPTFGFKQLFDDPVLQKAPSAALALKQYISGAIGPWPIADSHVGQIQQQLQIRGYGQNLPVSKTWNPDWNQEYNQFKNDLVNKQLAGDKGFGSASLKTVLQGLQALQPTSAFDAMFGFITAIPGEVRDLLAHSVGGFAAGGSFLTHVATGDNAQEAVDAANRTQAGTIASIETNLGHETTKQEVLKRSNQQILADLVQDVSTVLLATSAFGAGGRLVNAIGGESRVVEAGLGTQLSSQEAERAGGTIAKLLGSPALGETYGSTTATRVARGVAGAALGAGGAAATGTKNPYEILGATAGGAALGALSVPATSESKIAGLTRVFDNIPVLGNTGPVIDALVGDEGFYYKTRSLLAKPYSYAPVRVAGAAFQAGTLLGAEARGAAALQSMISPDGTTMSRAVQGTHTLDAVNDAVKFRVPYLGQIDLNALQFFLHGPTNEFIKGTEMAVPETKLSRVIGSQANTLLQGYNDALGNMGVHSVAERITRKTWGQIVKDSGGLEKANEMWSKIVADHAAWMEAEHSLAVERHTADLPTEIGLSDDTVLPALSARHDAILADPEATTDAVQKLLAQGKGTAGQELVDRVRRQTALSHGFRDDIQNTSQYMDAVYHTRRNILPHLGETVGDGDSAARQALIGASETEGNLGLARLDKYTIQDANREANELESQYQALDSAATAKQPLFDPENPETVAELSRPDITEYAALNEKMAGIFRQQFGINLADIPQTSWQDRVQLIRDNAQHLASDVTVNPEAAPELVWAEHQLHDMGYKLVNGTGIGHNLTAQMLPTDMMTGSMTYQRRIARFLGMDPTMVPNQSPAMERGTQTINEFSRLLKNGKVTVNTPYVGAPELYKMISSRGFIPEEQGFVGRLKRGVATVTGTERRLKKFADRYDIPMEDLQREMTRSLSLPDMPRSQFVEALSTPQGLHEHFPMIAELVNNGATHDQQVLNMARFDHPDMALMDRKSAENLYMGLVKANSRVPTALLGASHVEEIFRAGTQFMGKKFGDNELGWAVANLPNRLIQLRNEFRFELDPWFSMKRWVKTSAKLAAEGITPTWNPLEMMTEKGIWNEAKSTLERVIPERANPIFDSGDYYLRSQDIWIPNNVKAQEAWGAYNWAQQGLNDTQIREKIIHTFEYGVGGVSGRSALERSMNMVFFPFSFEKTVAKNLGGYLIDHPAQRVLLTKGLAAYNQFNTEHADNPLAVAFFEKHMPLFTEVANLNMFTHGISLGQFGGINRPILNLFLPQSWAPTKTNLDKLQEFIPAVKNFSRLWDELKQQGSVLGAVGENMLADLHGLPKRDPLDSNNPGVAQRASTLSPKEQLNEAFAMQNKWFDRYAEFIDGNAHTTKQENKTRFAVDSRWGKWAGEPITKQAIREIIQTYYPAYSADDVIKIAIDRNAEWKSYLLDTKSNPGLHAAVTDFADNTKRLADAMDRDKFSAQDVRNYTAGLRAEAIKLAEKDPQFYKLYAKNFQKTLGPLEAVR